MTSYGLAPAGDYYQLVFPGEAVTADGTGYYLPGKLAHDDGYYFPVGSTIGVLPVHTPSLREVLTGARETTFRYELLEHDPVSGVDSLAGYLDGVVPGGRVTGRANVQVRKTFTCEVLDLEAARPGFRRFADVDWNVTRIRPVRVVAGLPEMPLGAYVLTAAPESWSSTGRVFSVESHEKTTVLMQQGLAESFTAPAGVPVLQIVADILERCGETITVDASESRTLANPRVFHPGGEDAGSWLTVVNELLRSIGYGIMRTDPLGRFVVSPYVLPADRSPLYTVLNDELGAAMVRELVDGEESIYSPEWSRDRDMWAVPNRVVALSEGHGDSEPIVAYWDNTDPGSPFSIPSRGRVITPPGGPLTVEVPDFSEEVDPEAATLAFLQDAARRELVRLSQVTDAVKVSCLPTFVDVDDALIFESTPAGVNAMHTVVGFTDTLAFDGLQELELEMAVDL